MSAGSGAEVELEAFPDYWRRAPAVKTLVIKFITDNSNRFAGLVTGEIDLMTSLPASLYATARDTPVTVFPTRSREFWLEMPGWERPDSPFHDVRVRKAVSLALDRRASSDAEAAGLAPVQATWIPEEWHGTIKAADAPEAWRTDLAEAKGLMAEAGYPNGFDVSQLTPLPPFNSLDERVIGQIGIRTTVRQKERAGLILNLSSAPGDAASRIRSYALWNGTSSRTCIPEVDAKFAAYEASTDPAERTKLITEVQRMLLDLYVFPYAYSQSNLTVTGPRIANPPEKIWQATPRSRSSAPTRTSSSSSQEVGNGLEPLATPAAAAVREANAFSPPFSPPLWRRPRARDGRRRRQRHLRRTRGWPRRTAGSRWRR